MPIDKYPLLIPLEDRAIIWRYMNLYKFKSLLETKSLFFCRADKFSDPFEGSIPKNEVDFRQRAIDEMGDFHGWSLEVREKLKNDKKLESFHLNFKKSVVINCWHINNHESDAMWRLYLKDNEGVAIQTNKEKMCMVIENAKENILMSKVRYIDYHKDYWFDSIQFPHREYTSITPFLHKRIEFKHESEFRLFIQLTESLNKDDYWDKQPDHKGMLIPVDVNMLIDKVYLPPTIDEKAMEHITDFSKRFGFEFEYVKSIMSEAPLY